MRGHVAGGGGGFKPKSMAGVADAVEEIFVFAALGEADVKAARGEKSAPLEQGVVGGGLGVFGVGLGGGVGVVFAEDGADARAGRGTGDASRVGEAEGASYADGSFPVGARAEGA